MKISAAADNDFKFILNRVNTIREANTAEYMAQAVVNRLYDYFQESIVLLRLFSTVTLKHLPSQDQEFIARRGYETGTLQSIHDSTPILSLLGTRGSHDDWNDRRRSQRFLGIPLSSGEYVRSLPMLSMLFNTMQLPGGLIDEWNADGLSGEGLDKYSGTLYVRDAATDKDDQGRYIIPARDFVTAYNVKTVFGFGSGYSEYPAIMTLFFFTNEILDESAIEKFFPAVNYFKTASVNHIRERRIFQRGG